MTRRLPRVYPVYRPGFEWDVARLLLWAGELPSLRVLGRQGLFVPDNTHHALAMGWDCAGDRGRRRRVDAAAARRLPRHVVED